MEKSIFGGVSIAIGSYIFLQCSNKIVGAFCFALGLLIILNLNLQLYTGVIGFASTKADWLNAGKILIGNFIGCLIMIAYPTVRAQILMQNKLSHNWLITLINAIICGILIYIAVVCYRNEKDYMVVGCVAGFILFGAEHSIADICFAISAHSYNWATLGFILLVIIGNAIGSQMMNYVCNKSKKIV